MMIVRKTTMPDGTEIQLEYDSTVGYALGWIIGAYPTAKVTGKYGWVRRGKTFRLTIYIADGNEKISNVIFNALETGDLKLEDLHKFYWNGNKDMFYMGLRETED